MSNTPERINSIKRAFTVLEVLHSSPNEMGVSEIAARLGVYKSTIHRTLMTMKDEGYVYQNLDNEKFGLGVRLYPLGLAVEKRFIESFKSIADPQAELLASKYDAVVECSCVDLSISALRNSILYKRELPGNVLQYTPSIGSYTEAYASASGKVILANLEAFEFEKLKGIRFEKRTDNTINTWEKLVFEAERIREKGFAIDNEENVIGLICVGVFIVRIDKKIYALSLSGSAAKMKSYETYTMVKDLKSAAKEIAAAMLPSLG